MKRVTTFMRNYLWALALGVFGGLYLRDTAVLEEISFWIRPVVRMQGEIVGKPGPDFVDVDVRMWGEKVRGVECKYLGIKAYGQRAVGPMSDISIFRLEQPEDGSTKPKGSYQIGTWRLWPTTDLTGAKVVVTHDCSGGKRSTIIAEVKL